MRNWKRQYRLLIGAPGATGFEIGGEVRGRGIRIVFDLEKADTESSNDGTISVYNLNDEHKALLDTDGCIIELKAGYEDSMGTIYLGGVSDVSDELEDGDRRTDIEVIDGLFNYDSIGSVSMNGVVTCKKAAGAIIQKMNFKSVVYSEEASAKLSEAKYDNGYCCIGRLRDQLQKVCDKAEVVFTTQNGVLQIHAPGEAVNHLAYLLSPATGLIGVPKKIRVGDSATSSSSATRKKSAEDDSKGIPGYEVTFFMNGAVGVNDLVSVSSKEVSGVFLVHSIKYKGDNYGEDWHCVAELIEPGAK